MIIQDFVVIDNSIWYTERNYAALFRYDMDQKIIYMEVRLPSAALNEELQYGTIVKYEDFLVIYPIFAKNIVVFNFKTHDIYKYDIPLSTENNEFFGKFDAGEFSIALCKGRPLIAFFDGFSFSFVELKNNRTKDWCSGFNCAKLNDVLYVPRVNNKSITLINIKDKKVQDEWLTGESIFACYDYKGDLILVPTYGNKIKRIETKRNTTVHVYVVSMDEVFKKDEILFMCSVLLGDKLYIFSTRNGKMLCVNLCSGEVNPIKRKGNNKGNQCYYSRIARVENKIWILNRESNRLDIVDCLTDSINGYVDVEGKICVPKTEKICINTREILYENEVIYLTKWIDNI